jgi:hypothetical protein
MDLLNRQHHSGPEWRYCRKDHPVPPFLYCGKGSAAILAAISGIMPEILREHG